MGEEEPDPGLGQPVERPSLRNDIPDELVVPLAANSLQRPVGFEYVVERLAVPDAFGDGGVDFGDVLVGDAPVGPRGVPIPYGEGIRVDASDLYLGL